jgi:5'-deoxy-5'-methylthioadenosine phosphorylase
MTAPIGIIGGSGLEHLPGLAPSGREEVTTPYGAPSDAILRGTLAGVEVAYLARHGARHELAPHEVNYRANLWALHALGVRRVVAVNTVGGIARHLMPGTLAVPAQIVDYTYGRAHTYFDKGAPVRHVDFTRPYTEGLRRELIAAATAVGATVDFGGVYAATQGPRLETTAEIDRLERDGCDMVGMTGMPEAALARELELEYACLAIVVNRAAGRGAATIQAQIEQYLAQGVARALDVLVAFLRAQAVPR